MPRWLNWKWLGVVALALVAVMAFSACGGDDNEASKTPSTSGTGGASATGASENWGSVTIKSGSSIVVGFTGPRSGDLIALGTAGVDGAKVAIDDVGGKVKGFPITIKEADDKCDAGSALSAAEILLADKALVGVLGGVCSGVNVAAQPRYEEAHITQISGSSTATKVTNPEGRGPFATFLRTIVNDSVQGKRQAAFANQVIKAKSAYVAYDTDAYGTGLRDVFKTEFPKVGGTIAGDQGFEKGTTEFTSLSTSITSAKPDMVYFAGFDPEAAALLRQLRADGYKGAFLGGDGVQTAQFLTLAGADAEGAYLSKGAPIQESAVLTKFQSDFQTKAGYKWDDQPYTAEYHDAMLAILKAVDKVGVVSNGDLTIDLKKLNDAMHASDFDGVSGHIKFDDHGDLVAVPGRPQILFSKVTNGAYAKETFE
ncbi:MAG TPA: branched-chain amino acid ABC transporter substrate-binding protein [Dehalococcoidia bacterium]|nr:branched-chain amino acid ABC transporter substrate-binding protein [Dehalococcoidia bacterium]